MTIEQKNNAITAWNFVYYNVHLYHENCDIQNRKHP